MSGMKEVVQGLIAEGKTLAAKLKAGYGRVDEDRHPVSKQDVDAVHNLIHRIEAALGLATEAAQVEQPAQAQEQEAQNGTGEPAAETGAETGSQEAPAENQGASEGAAAGSQPGAAS